MKHHFSAELQPIGIDEKNGIIRGAVACQAGLEAKGHSLKTDGVLLRQLLLSARAKGDKLPVHLDHKSGAAGCIGTAQNFRLDGDKLRCDLHFFRSHDKYKSTMELLSNLYETAGLSASFVGDSEKGMARSRDFLAVDVVVFPAAVANGLFSALDENEDQTESTEDIPMNEMNEDQIAELLHELLDHVQDLTSHIEQIEAENAAMAEALEALQGDDDDGDDEDDSEDDQEAVLSPKGAAAGPHDYRSALRSHDFESRVADFQASGKSQKDAHIAALKEFARSQFVIQNL
jgi:hypothetical protein